ncbi:MAG: gliding motility-associated C-terminal domain-containing protein [Lewinellaceae bacterium]|nr:gliding motility-associated C-terminal domain-containing protein [Lewinellaceae bacterium]
MTSSIHLFLWPGLFLFFFPQNFLAAQNLIKNPGFEEYYTCPNDEGQLSYSKHWSTYFSTPDYFNKCGYYPEWVDTIPPRTGNAFAGARWFALASSSDIRREYLHGELTRSLIEEVYYLEYYVHPMSYGIAIDQYSAHFSQTPISDIPPDGTLYLEPHVQNQNGIISDLEWVRLSGCFTAKGGERYLTLGNFVSNAETDTLNPVDAISIQRHYALIDDVALYSLSSLIPSDTVILEGESLSFNTSLPLSYRLNGEALPGGQFAPDSAGLYTIEVALEPCGAIGSFQVEVYTCEALGKDYEPFLSDTSVCLEEGWQLVFPRTDTYNYRINGQLATENVFAPADTGYYEILVELPGCIVLDTIRILALDCTIKDEAPDCFFIPSAFSPNGDGRNDYFRLYGPCQIQAVEARIFDRWGGLLFESTDPDFRWDGMAGGKAVSNGLYVYAIRLVFVGEDKRVYEREEKGAVVLLR